MNEGTAKRERGKNSHYHPQDDLRGLLGKRGEARALSLFSHLKELVRGRKGQEAGGREGMSVCEEGRRMSHYRENMTSQGNAGEEEGENKWRRRVEGAGKRAPT